MLGTIIGDIIGSPYEFSGIKDPDLPMKTKESTFTDDTICTIATMDWLLHSKNFLDYEDYLLKWCWQYPEPKGGYGASFKKWLDNPDRRPYNSFGNGSAMRVSPIAFFAKDFAEADALAYTSALPTHDHEEGIKGARAVVSMIKMASMKYPRGFMKDKIKADFGYPIRPKIKDIVDGYKYSESCQETVPASITAFLDAVSYYTSMKNCLALGGDADTLCAITGGISEAYFGLPKMYTKWAWSKLPEDFKYIISKYYEKVKQRNNVGALPVL